MFQEELPTAKLRTPQSPLILLFLLGYFLLCPLPASAADQSPRVRESFDFDWRFHLGDVPGGESLELDDNSWRELSVPHDWSVEYPFSQEFASGTGYLPGGIGWYRKIFEAPASWQGKEVQIHFDGVYRNSEVWINGKSLGVRPYGYAPFSYRLTPDLQIGEKNVIAVRVAREEVADSRWYPGTGIYRHVWLTVTEPVHVEKWGTFVTTPRVTDERADISVSSEVVNRGDTQVELRIETAIVDPAGNRSSEQSTNATLPAGASETMAHWHVAEKPQRWTLEVPTLYAVQTRVYAGDKLLDEVQVPFGIRTYYFDANRGFFLNGEPLLIKGLCMHHDAGVVGAAVPDKVLERRLRIVKELGANAVRCSHNPMAAEFYEMCDRLGLLVMDEAFDEWELGKRKWVEGRNVGQAQRFGYNEHFEEWAERDVAAMVRRGRNHPSIILWSIGNEIDYPGDPYVHPEFFDPAAPPADAGSPRTTRLAVVAPSLIAAVKRHDPTRPVTMALSNMPASNGIGLANMLDVAGYNYQEQFYEQDHRDFPGRVIYGSENGQSLRSWQAVEENDYISSLYYWVGFDFLGEAGRWPNRGSQAGVFDTRGFYKPFSWSHRMRWSEEPLVRILVSESGDDSRRRRRRFRLADHPRLWKAEAGATVPVLISTNCEAIELTLNGKPIEVSAAPFGNFYRAEVPFAAGELVATGLREDQPVASDMLKTPGTAAEIQLIADREQLVADGQDAAHVEIRIVDSDGQLVSDCDSQVTVKVSGAGRLLGVDNGDQNDTTDLKNPSKQSRDGRLLAIVQSLREAGTVEMEAKVEGLPAASLNLVTGP